MIAYLASVACKALRDNGLIDNINLDKILTLEERTSGGRIRGSGAGLCLRTGLISWLSSEVLVGPFNIHSCRDGTTYTPLISKVCTWPVAKDAKNVPSLIATSLYIL